MKLSIILSTCFITFLCCYDTAWALATPESGAFGYELYDLAINDILDGPIGFLGGTAAIVMGGYFAIRQQIMQSLPCIIGGGAILNADSLVNGLGLLL
jgi:hypothetical protein